MMSILLGALVGAPTRRSATQFFIGIVFQGGA
jgi:hypothetical protein